MGLKIMTKNQLLVKLHILHEKLQVGNILFNPDITQDDTS